MTAFSLSRRQAAAALVGLNLLLAIGGWMLLVAPQRHRASSAAQKLAQTRTEIAQLTSSKPTPHGQPVIKTSELYRLAAAMPAAENEPDLLLGLDQFAQQWGVKLLGITPLTPAVNAAGYTTLPLTLTAAGSYGSLTRFLNRMRGLVSVDRGTIDVAGPLYSVMSVSLAPDPKGKTETATITVNAFYFGALAGATPAPSPPASTSTTTTSGG